MRFYKSAFSEIKADPPIELFQLYGAFIEDEDQKKINLGVGAYKDENGKPWILSVVKAVEKQYADDLKQDFEYLPILGLPELANATVKLVLGEDSPLIKDNRAFGIHAASGTAALKIGANFLKRNGFSVIYVSDPTWVNHPTIFETSDFEVKTYRYYNLSTKSLDFEGLIEDFKEALPNSVVLLQACCHNPSGLDLNIEQWAILSQLIKEKQLFPFFDLAYQGFSSGDLNKDAESIRLFAEQDHEMLIAQSFSKNMGLYSERVGSLTVVVNEPNIMPTIKTQLTTIIRVLYSNPPAHGARVALKILTNENSYIQWKEDVKRMAERTKLMRKLLHEKLSLLQPSKNWDYLLKSFGLFAFSGLTKTQCKYLMNQYHIYLPSDSRINIAAITTANVDYIANAINDSLTKREL